MWGIKIIRQLPGILVELSKWLTAPVEALSRLPLRFIGQDLVTCPWPLQERLEMHVPGVSASRDGALPARSRDWEWLLSGQPAVFTVVYNHTSVAGSKFICLSVHGYTSNINTWGGGIHKRNDFSLNLPPLSNYTVFYIKSLMIRFCM